MGFLNVLTIVFVIAKIVGAIDWSWLIVFAPTMLSAVIFIAVFLFGVFSNLLE